MSDLPFVVDASVICCALLPDETTLQAVALFQAIGREGAFAPALWQTEVANTLTMAMRRNRLSRARRDSGLAGALRLPITSVALDARDIVGRVVPLADAHGLTAYDASYLLVALERGLALATLDRALASAAKREGVVIL